MANEPAGGTTEKPRDLVVRVVRQLAAALQDNWGNPGRFQEAALPEILRLAKEHYDELSAANLADQVFRHTTRLHNQYFRPLTDAAQVDKTQAAMETAQKDPVLQGCLWLAARMQSAALSYFSGAQGKAQYNQVVSFLAEQASVLAKTLTAQQFPTQERLEGRVTDLARDSLGNQASRFYQAMLAGRLLDKASLVSRYLGDPTQPIPFDQGPLQSTPDEAKVLTLLAVPVRTLALDDAKMRMAKYDDAKKAELVAYLKKALGMYIAKVIPHAPHGFDAFAKAVENAAFPYPRPLEWIRPLLKGMYDQASQVTFFKECKSLEEIDRRYRALVGDKSVNPLVVAIARGLAQGHLGTAKVHADDVELVNLHLVEEFGYPANLKQMIERMKL